MYDAKNPPRLPVRFVEANGELLKSQRQPVRHTVDYKQEEYVEHAVMEATYRTPPDRVSGNQFFRRYVTGQLDYAYAAHKVLDAMNRYKQGGGVDTLNSEERSALSILFPMQFNFMDSGMLSTVAAVQFRLSPEDIERIRQVVAAHIAEELNWNAGQGGGSVPGRSHTKVD